MPMAGDEDVAALEAARPELIVLTFERPRTSHR